jgi:hypothetical protein
MQYAQTPRKSLTRVALGRWNDRLMQFGRIVLVLIGIVLVERAYVRAGG